MSKIRIHAPDGSPPHNVELPEATALLVGRSPGEQLDQLGELVSEPARVERLALGPLSISANHVLLQNRAGHLLVTDVSRNGTWLRMPAGRCFDAGEYPVYDLQLAGLRYEVREAEIPFPPVRWTGRADYDTAIAAMVRSWMSAHGVTTSVEITSAAADERTPVFGVLRLPLPDRRSLEVRTSTTVNDDAEWARLIERLWQHVAAQNRLFLAEEQGRAEGLTLSSEAIRSALRAVIGAAERGQRLVLMGETGSGKEGLAGAYHRATGRKGDFVAINCGRLHPDRAEADLFGTVPGGFTGAVARPGAIEEADGGTLFLDEIHHLDSKVQTTLLRFLDSGKFSRMGESRVRTADVRLVCAANVPLRDEVRAGRMKHDLWFRLAGQIVEVPPLRLRPDDLRGFLAARRHPGAASAWAALAPEAQSVALSARWSGNFRELGNFADNLPAANGEGSIKSDTCREIIARGTLDETPFAPEPARASERLEAQTAWHDLAPAAARIAAQAYQAHQKSVPQQWSEVKDFLELFLKPVLFAHLSGGAQAPSVDAARASASKLGADRATASKQLERYFELLAADPARPG